MSKESTSHSGVAALTIAAIGVVYGDIGTSPLYTMKEVFAPAHGIASSPANIIGVVSLILWCLLIVISLKYVTLVLKADNNGEGGIMALTALALTSVTQNSRFYYPVMLLGMVGAMPWKRHTSLPGITSSPHLDQAWPCGAKTFTPAWRAMAGMLPTISGCHLTG